jgi:hypothetical protein
LLVLQQRAFFFDSSEIGAYNDWLVVAFCFPQTVEALERRMGINVFMLLFELESILWPVRKA